VQGDDWPALPGTYVLLLDVSGPLLLTVGRLGRHSIPTGRYAYVGSARGPGGLAARLARHLRPGKPLHWHIDHLTAQAPITGVLAGPDAASRECAWLHALLDLPGAGVPVPGFGSSDCRNNCPAHLVSLPASYPLSELIERLKP
jgi:Uri superfamily endonuclease